MALPDTFHARAGRPRILHPLGNDQNPSGKPLRILKILEQPRGSTARVVQHGHAIRLRLPHGMHGAQRLVYLVSTAAGEIARGLITVIMRRAYAAGRSVLAAGEREPHAEPDEHQPTGAADQLEPPG